MKNLIGLVFVAAMIGVAIQWSGQDEQADTQDFLAQATDSDYANSSDSSESLIRQSDDSDDQGGLLSQNTISNHDLSDESEQVKKILFRARVFGSTEAYEQASAYGRLPSFMRDVTIEQMDIDANGNLVLNEKIKHVIEFFLLGEQAEGREQTIDRLREYISLTMPDTALEEALEIAMQYVDYKDNIDSTEFALSSDLNDPEVLANIRKALEAKQAVRREYLGDIVSDALFAYEESYDMYSITRIEVNTDDSLNDAQKEAALSAAESRLPPTLAKKVRYNREEESLKKDIAQLKAQGGQETLIYEKRKAFYGKATADRFAFLEDNSPSWQARVTDFSRAQMDILNGEGNQEEKYEQIVALKEQMFTKKEQIKLAVQGIRSQSS